MSVALALQPRRCPFQNSPASMKSHTVKSRDDDPGLNTGSGYLRLCKELKLLSSLVWAFL